MSRVLLRILVHGAASLICAVVLAAGSVGKLAAQIPDEFTNLKVLSKDRDKRYDNLDKLNRALVKFLYSQYPDFNPSDLSFFASKLFESDIERDRKKIFEIDMFHLQL